MIGLNEVPNDIPITQPIEVGWRLARRWWGQGLATEAGIASLNCAFGVLDQDVVVAFTSLQNLRSHRVMAKLGMTELNARFNHPHVPAHSSLSEHVLYQISRECFESRNA